MINYEIFLGAAVTYAIGMVNGDWDKYGEIIMAIVAIELGFMLLFVGIAESLAQSYIYYIIFCCTYQTMLTISR